MRFRLIQSKFCNHYVFQKIKFMNKQLNVLVTNVGSNTTISIIKGLKKQDEYGKLIAGTDINSKKNIAGTRFCSTFYIAPSANDSEKYIQILTLGQKYFGLNQTA